MGGAIGSLLGAALYAAGNGQPVWLVIGWMVAGLLIGAASGLFDLLRAILAKRELGQAVRKSLNGVYGGLLGGLLGGLPFGLLTAPAEDGTQPLPLSGLAIGLTILGICIGLMVALAQVFLKEAWILVESGRRAGRQLMLSKEETTIGRAEACDLGLFGDNAIEKLHARILLKKNRYVLDDAETPEARSSTTCACRGPHRSRTATAIRVGGCVLRFGEKQKKH